MNIVSALGIAGALLLGASAPALAQVYPVDPGYDQGPAYGTEPGDEGPDYGPPGRVEVLPPGGRYVVPGPAYGGGYAEPGPYREDEEVLGGEDGYPVYREEAPQVYRRRHEHADDRRGERFRQESQAARPDGYRWPDENFGHERQLRDRRAEQQRRRLPRGDEANPDAQ